MLPSQISVENIAALVGVGIAAAWVAFRQYVTARKTTPAQESADLAILAGASIADMRAVKSIGEDIKRIANAAESIATSMADSAEEDEIERRAKARAAEMVASEAQRRRRT